MSETYPRDVLGNGSDAPCAGLACPPSDCEIMAGFFLLERYGWPIELLPEAITLFRVLAAEGILPVEYQPRVPRSPMIGGMPVVPTGAEDGPHDVVIFLADL